jgi:hypothetical protein
MTNEKRALGVIAIVCAGTSLGCEKTQAEREQEAMEEQQERRAEVREERAEVREETEEARYDAPKTEANVNPAASDVAAAKGLEAATVKQIADARCAREQKCGNIGTDEDYASAEACRQKITADWAEEVNAYECSGGVVQKELDECLEEIKNEDCASPFDTLGRVVACRSSDICRAVD